MQLRDLFNLSLTGRANVTALEYDQSDGTIATLTFGELEARSNRVAHLLTARGLSRGDRLGFYLPNSVEFIDLFLACVKLGVIVVPMNVLYRERELSHIVTDAEPKAVVTTRELAANVPAGAAVWHIDEVTAAAEAQSAELPRLALDCAFLQNSRFP